MGNLMTMFCFLRCFFFGDVSSKRDPTAYLTYISTLYDYYRREYCVSNQSGNRTKTELPLIINTPGWVKGIIVWIVHLWLFLLLFEILNKTYSSFIPPMSCLSQKPKWLSFTLSLLSMSLWVWNYISLFLMCRCWLWHIGEYVEACCSYPCC